MTNTATSPTPTPWTAPTDRALALETSGPVASVAIGTPVGLALQRAVTSSLRHGAAVLPVVRDMCRDAGWPIESLTACFVSVGPGSFTGLRVGVTIARTLAWSLKLQLAAAPTAEAIAQNGVDTPDSPLALGVMFNAGRGRIFGTLLNRTADGFVTVEAPAEVDAKEWLGRLARGTAVTGEAAAEHEKTIRAFGLTLWPPERAVATAAGVFEVGRRMARAGRFTTVQKLKPLYIRQPSAVEKLNAGLLRSTRRGGPTP